MQKIPIFPKHQMYSCTELTCNNNVHTGQLHSRSIYWEKKTVLFYVDIFHIQKKKYRKFSEAYV